MSTVKPAKEADFRAVLEPIARKRGSLVSVFNDFVCLSACALAMQTREEEYLEIAGRYGREEIYAFAKAMGLLVNEMESAPFTDVLGPYYCEVQSKFSRDAGGEFYTPQPVGKLMAKISVNAEQVIEAGKPVTVCDPASGSGGLILSVAEAFAQAGAVDLIRATCQDISKTGCDMAYINMTLWGIPARIIWGDTLRNTVNAQWENIHWRRVDEPLREQISEFMDLLNAPLPAKNDRSTGVNSEKECHFQTNQSGQQEWVFE